MYIVVARSLVAPTAFFFSFIPKNNNNYNIYFYRFRIGYIISTRAQSNRVQAIGFFFFLQISYNKPSQISVEKYCRNTRCYRHRISDGRGCGSPRQRSRIYLFNFINNCFLFPLEKYDGLRFGLNRRNNLLFQESKGPMQITH